MPCTHLHRPIVGDSTCDYDVILSDPVTLGSIVSTKREDPTYVHVLRCHKNIISAHFPVVCIGNTQNMRDDMSKNLNMTQFDAHAVAVLISVIYNGTICYPIRGWQVCAMLQASHAAKYLGAQKISQTLMSTAVEASIVLYMARIYSRPMHIPKEKHSSSPYDGQSFDSFDDADRFNPYPHTEEDENKILKVANTLKTSKDDQIVFIQTIKGEKCFSKTKWLREPVRRIAGMKTVHHALRAKVDFVSFLIHALGYITDDAPNESDLDNVKFSMNSILSCDELGFFKKLKMSDTGCEQLFGILRPFLSTAAECETAISQLLAEIVSQVVLPVHPSVLPEPIRVEYQRLPMRIVRSLILFITSISIHERSVVECDLHTAYLECWREGDPLARKKDVIDIKITQNALSSVVGWDIPRGTS